VADPAIYETKLYRMIAFCKVAVVLGLLRDRLGDETFFRAWKHVFTSLRGRPVDFDDVQRAFAASSGVDLGRFFDDWFFQAGHPALRVSWKAHAADSGSTLALVLEQVQPRGIYSLDVPIEVTLDSPPGTRTLTVPLTGIRTEVSLPLPGVPHSLRVDPHGTLPLRAEVSRAP
jgi:aminopeptidase N